jgi:cytosine/adenosine deaminase-related metal-dependent hydrolase
VFVCAPAPWAEADAGRLAAGLPASTDRAGSSTTLALGSTSPAASRLDRVASDFAAARDRGLRIHAHAGVQEADSGAVSALGGRGLLGDDVTLVHCSHVGEADVAAIADSGAAVSLTPASDMTGGLGSPPLQRLIDRGIRPGLGIDSDGMAPGDMFAQLRAVISLQHATYFEQKLAGRSGLPNLLTTREVLRYGTVYGARAAGVGGVTGSLAPGRQADLVVLRADRPNIWPINDPIGAVVWGMDTSNVDWVLAGGKVLMRHGELEGDVARARRLAITAQQRVASAAGLLSGAAP